MPRLKTILLGLLLVLLVAAVGAGLYFGADARPPDSAAMAQVPFAQYAAVPLGFKHDFAGMKSSLPFLGSALLDVDGDGWEELFLGGGRDQQDGLFEFEEGQFGPAEAKFQIRKEVPDATYGAAAIDANRDGRTDLFVLRDSGLWLHVNGENGFESRHVEIPLHESTVGLSLAAADLDHDGWVDLFVAGYLRPDRVEGLTIFNDETYGGRSLLLRNRGDNTFEDVTAPSGLEFVHNTFQGTWVDLDDDADLDLVVAHDTGQVRTYRNMSRGSRLRFENVDNPTSDAFAYPMGIAVGDVDQDERPDLFFSNIGTTVPEFAARGDLRDDQLLLSQWILLRNLGDFRFEDIAESARLADYEFSWGAVLDDFNLDGRQDLVVSENFIDYLPHRFVKLPGRFLLQNEDGTFAPVGEASGASNPSYGISPLAVDLNGDGYLDLVHANLEGASRAQVSLGGLDRRFVQIGVPARPRWIGARVTVTTTEGRRWVRWWTPSEGLCSSQSRVLTFGLGNARGVERVDVRLANGQTGVVTTPPIDARTELSGSIFRRGGGRVRTEDG